VLASDPLLPAAQPRLRPALPEVFDERAEH
jgi:hypothetical protein